MITEIRVIPRDTPAVSRLHDHNAALCLSVARLEGQLEEAHAALAFYQAENRRLAVRGPHWWEWVSAWLVCRLDAANRRMKHWGL